MRLTIRSLFFLLPILQIAAPSASHAATCFCKVTANGQEVAKPSKGGFIQLFQKEACRNYCRGTWDSKSSADLSSWAELASQCGGVELKMEAAIGTAEYKEVRKTTVEISCAPPSCNLLRNGSFSFGLNPATGGTMPGASLAGWSAAFGTPQIGSGPGCGGNPGAIGLWGNQIVGEAIQQTLSKPLVPGHTYKLSGCARWVSSAPPTPQYVRFRVRASTGPLATYNQNAVDIGTFGNSTNTPPVAAPGITSQAWTEIALADWTAPATTSLNTITVSPINDSAIDDGDLVSFGQIDSLCLQDPRQACVRPNPDFALTAVSPSTSSSMFRLTATADPLPTEAGFWWRVEELDLVSGAVLPATTVTNPAAWWSDPETNDFSGYDGTASLNTSLAPGRFETGHKYRITRGVWDVCNPWTSATHTVFMDSE